MRDLGDYEASGRKTNQHGMRLAMESPNPVSDFMCGQYSCVGDVTKGERNDIHSRVLAGSTLQHYSIWLTVQRKLTSCTCTVRTVVDADERREGEG